MVSLKLAAVPMAVSAVLAICLLCSLAREAKTSIGYRSELAEAKEEANRAKEDRDGVVKLAAGGWTFNKPVPYTEAEQMQRKIKWLEDVYESSVQSRAQCARDISGRLSRWDKQIQNLASKLADHKEELARLQAAGK